MRKKGVILHCLNYTCRRMKLPDKDQIITAALVDVNLSNCFYFLLGSKHLIKDKYAINYRL